MRRASAKKLANLVRKKNEIIYQTRTHIVAYTSDSEFNTAGSCRTRIRSQKLIRRLRSLRKEGEIYRFTYQRRVFRQRDICRRLSGEKSEAFQRRHAS